MAAAAAPTALVNLTFLNRGLMIATFFCSFLLQLRIFALSILGHLVTWRHAAAAAAELSHLLHLRQEFHK